jgi:hypothetical protein
VKIANYGKDNRLSVILSHANFGKAFGRVERLWRSEDYDGFAPAACTCESVLPALACSVAGDVKEDVL